MESSQIIWQPPANGIEKTELASLKYYKKTELFLPYVILGVLLLSVGKTLELTLFKTIE